MNRPFITLCCMLLCMASQGQSGDTIKLQQTIGKNYVPAIAHSEKISDQPSIVHLKMQQPDIKGSMIRKQMIFGYAPEPILPARMKGEPLTKLYRSCVKLGVGNYTTSYAEAFVNNNRSRDYSVGAHFKHLSSQGQLKDVGNSAYSENSIDLYGKKFLKKHLLNAGVKAGRDVVHFYGYDPQQYEFFDSDNTKQRFLNYAVNAGIMSFYKDSTMINHNAELAFRHLGDYYSASEDNVQGKLYLTRYFNRELFAIDGQFDYNRFEVGDALSAENTLLGISPMIISRGDKWRLKAGMRIFMDAGSSASFHFYPDAIFRYNVVGNLIIPYLGVTGGMQRNSFNSLTTKNPWLISNPVLRNSRQAYKLYGGIRGVMGSDLSFNTYASKSRTSDMPLFASDLDLIPDVKFEVIYDQVTTTNIGAELDYGKFDKLDILLRGDYFDYDMLEELKPWNLPSYKVTVTGLYNLRDKIVIRAEFYAISSRWAKVRDISQGEDIGYGMFATKLSGTVDVNIGVEYRYTKKLAAFIRLNNIGNIRYYQWNNYPTQRFNALGGISYSFWAK